MGQNILGIDFYRSFIAFDRLVFFADTSERKS